MTHPQPTPFDSRTEARFVLWHRASRRHKWRAVGAAATGSEALALMDGTGHHNGDWMLIDDGTDPNTKQETAP